MGTSGTYTLGGGTLNVTGQISGGPLIINGPGYWSAQSIVAPLVFASSPTVTFTSSLESSQLSTGANYVGQSGTVSLVQSGGTQSAGWLYLGYNNGSSGTYSLSGGSLYAGTEYVGYSGSGTIAQTGGTNTVGSINLGQSASSIGCYSLSGDQLTVQSSENIGYSGTGVFTQTGGTHSVSGTLYLGNYSFSSGSYSLSNGELTVQNQEYIGYSGTGAFTQTGGTHSVGGTLYLGNYSGSSGSYSLSNGQLTVQNEEYIGYFGNADTFNQTGGTQSINGKSSNINLTVGYYSGSASYSLSDGELLVQGSETIGVNVAGTFTQSGGTHSVSGTLYLGANSGSSGSYSLSNGQLTVGSISIGSDAICTLTGGTSVQQGRSPALDR